MSRRSRTHQRKPCGYKYRDDGKPDFTIARRLRSILDAGWKNGETIRIGDRYHVLFGERSIAIFDTIELANKYISWCMEMPDFEHYWYGQTTEKRNGKEA